MMNASSARGVRSAAARRPLRRARHRAPLALAALGVAAVPAWAGEWIPGLWLDTRATLTDNYRLAPEGREEAELVLQATPVLSLRRTGDRASALIDYAPTLYVYTTNWSENYVRQRLNARLSVEAVENFFYVDAYARATPTFFSPFLPGTVEDVGITDNQLQNLSLGLSPYIQGMSPGGYRYLLRNDNYWTTTDSSSLPDQLDQRLSARVDSPYERRYGWSADYNYRTTDFENSPAVYEQQARLIGRYRISPDLSVNARVGYETNDYSFDDYSGSIYGAGLTWTPTPRTRLSGFAEHRFFGTGYEASLSHRTRITSWRLRGSRDTNTYRDQVFALPPGDTRELLDATFSSRIPDPIERELAVQEFLASSGLPPTLDAPLSFYTNRIYVANRVDASAGLFGVRNAVSFGLFYRENEPITPSGTQLPDVFAGANRLRQRGGILTASRRLGARSSLSASVRRTYSDSADVAAFGGEEIDSTEDVLRLTFSQQLSPRTGAAAGFRWVEFDTEVPNGSYQERAVFVAISHRFF